MQIVEAGPRNALDHSGSRLFALIPRALVSPGAHRVSLRDAVTDYARGASAADVPPEQAIIELKRVIREQAASRASYRVCNALTDDVVRWFIEAYYGSGVVRSA
jgi:hypothetical protein